MTENNEDIDNRLKMAYDLCSSEDYDKALIYIEQYLEDNPNSDNEWVNKGVILIKMNMKKEAIICYEKAIKVNPQNWRSWYYKADALKHDNFEESDKCYQETIKINPNNSDVWIDYIDFLIYYRKLEDADSILDIILEGHPSIKDFLIRKANVLYMLHQPDESLKYLKTVEEIDNSDTNLWYIKGSIELDKNNFSNAIEHFNKSIKSYEGHFYAHWKQGLAFSGLGKHNDAIASFDKAIKLQPMEMTFWHDKQYSLLQLERYEDLIECCNKALEINPTDIASYEYKGLIYRQLGKFDDAIKCYTEALKYYPDNEKIYFNKAIVECTKLDLFNAISSFEKVLELNPENEKAKQFCNLSKKCVAIFDYTIKASVLGKKDEEIERDLEPLIDDFNSAFKAVTNIEYDFRELIQAFKNGYWTDYLKQHESLTKKVVKEIGMTHEMSVNLFKGQISNELSDPITKQVYDGVIKVYNDALNVDRETINNKFQDVLLKCITEDLSISSEYIGEETSKLVKIKPLLPKHSLESNVKIYKGLIESYRKVLSIIIWLIKVIEKAPKKYRNIKEMPLGEKLKIVNRKYPDLCITKLDKKIRNTYAHETMKIEENEIIFIDKDNNKTVISREELILMGDKLTSLLKGFIYALSIIALEVIPNEDE